MNGSKVASLGLCTILLVGGSLPNRSSHQSIAAAPSDIASTTLNPLQIAWNASPGATLGRYNPGTLVGEQFSTPAIGDLDGNGSQEVVVGSVDGRINIYDASSGAFVRRFAVSNVPGVVTSSPVLADLQGNGTLDIVVGFMPAQPSNDDVPSSTDTIAAFTPQGTRLWGMRACPTLPQHFCDIFSSPVIADLDGDGLPDVIFTSQDQKLHAVRGLNGAELPGFPLDLLDTSWSTPAVADLYGNGQKEIVVASDVAPVTCQHFAQLGCAYGTILRIVSSTGQVLHQTALNGEIPQSSPVIGHIQGPGTAPQIIIGAGNTFWSDKATYPLSSTASRRIYALSNTLDILPGWNSGPLVDSPNIATPALADPDGNGLDTVYTISETGELYAFWGNGTVRWGPFCARDSESACTTAQPWVGRSSPVVADVNDDGRLDVVVITEHTLRLFDAQTGAEENGALLVYPSPGGTFPFAATPTVTSLNGVATIFLHGLWDTDANGSRDAGDTDLLTKVVAPNDLGADPWPTFHGNPDHTGTEPRFSPAPPAGCTSTDNGKFTRWLFQRLLGVDPTGSQYVEDCTIMSMAPGQTGRAFAASMSTRSKAWITQVVENFYQQILGRAGDIGGVNYWTGQILDGERQRDVAISFYGSNEQYSLWGGTPADATPYVTQLYLHLLARSPDPAGLAYWSQLALVDHAAAAAAFYQSAESRRNRVQSMYAQLLCRPPDPGGLLYWANLLATQDDLTLTSQLMVSNEFYQDALRASCPIA